MHSRSRRPGPKRSSDSQPSRATKAVAPLAAVDRPPDIESFRDWELAPEVLDALDDSGITSPTPIQRLAIGPALDGYDVIAKAETGTGKTIAFGAPLISRIDARRTTVLGLVLCPTRELAQQVEGVLRDLGKARGVKTALIVGGDEMEPQILALRAGAQVVVGTPGRVLDLHQRKLMSFPWTEFVVLDEADEMLEIGFLPDVEKILSRTPQERQTLLFSATFPPPLLRLAREHTRNPVEVATAAGVKTVDNIRQTFMRVGEDDRPLALLRLIERSDPDDVFLVFCDRRTDVDVLFRRLGRAPFPIKALHGGYDQPSRFRVMSSFRNREVKALVATDVAARGLDVAHVTHVVNFAVPRDISDYTHRIGRTGRAGREGSAITFVVPSETGRWRRIIGAATWTIPESEPPGPRSFRDDRRDGSDRAPRSRDARDDRRSDDDRPPRRADSDARRDDRGRGRDDDARDDRSRTDSRDRRETDDPPRARGARDDRGRDDRERDSAPRRDEAAPRGGAHDRRRDHRREDEKPSRRADGDERRRDDPPGRRDDRDRPAARDDRRPARDDDRRDDRPSPGGRTRDDGHDRDRDEPRDADRRAKPTRGRSSDRGDAAPPRGRAHERRDDEAPRRARGRDDAQSRDDDPDDHRRRDVDGDDRVDDRDRDDAPKRRPADADADADPPTPPRRRGRRGRR